MKILTMAFVMSLILPSCNKTEEFKTTSEINIDKRNPFLWGAAIWAAAKVIIAVTEGQKQGTTTTTTTSPDGTIVSVTTGGGCDGAGSCGGSIAYQGDDIGSGNEYDYVEDYFLNEAYIVISEENEIILAVDESDPNIEKVFYSDNVAFLSDNYVVDNPNFLDALELVESFEIIAGEYEVMQQDNYKYIVVGTASF